MRGRAVSDLKLAPATPMAPFVKIGADDLPYLEGVVCGACREVLALEGQRACPKCATVGALEPVRLAERGRLYAYTIVHRSFPGVKTPFVAALVDLEGGGSIKGNLVGVAFDDIRFDMALAVTFERLPSPDGAGEAHVRHVFTPMAG